MAKGEGGATAGGRTSVLRALWIPAGTPDDVRDGRIGAAMAGFAPRDEVGGMLAGQAVALHAAAMECLRRAMIPEQPAEIASKLRRDGANLARAAAEMTDAVERRGGKGPRQGRAGGAGGGAGRRPSHRRGSLTAKGGWGTGGRRCLTGGKTPCHP